VPALAAEQLRHALNEIGWTKVRFELERDGHRAHVFNPGVTFCGCQAEIPHRQCVKPSVDLLAEGAVVSLWPALQGPCRTAKAKSKLYSAEEVRSWGPDGSPEAPTKDALPFRRRTRVVTEPSQCISVPRERGSVDLGVVEAMLIRGVQLAPGCPYGTVSANVDTSWGELQVVLAFMALDRGWEPAWYVDPDHRPVDPNIQCTDTILEEDLPEAAPELVLATRSRGGCPSDR
jgi:hypothetical protein